MRARFEALLERYGQAVRLEKDGSDLRAFVQPVLKRREEPPVAPTPLGAVSGERWLYIGRGAVPLTPGDRLECGGRLLVVQEAQRVFWQEEAFYCWALLRPGKEAAL